MAEGSIALEDELKVASGETVQVFFELENPPISGGVDFEWGATRDQASRRARVAKGAFEEGMMVVRACAEKVASTVLSVSEEARPNTIEVEFGLKITGSAGVYFVQSGAEGHLKVKLAWTRKAE